MRSRAGLIVNIGTALAFLGVAALCLKGSLPLGSSESRGSGRQESQLTVGNQLPRLAGYDWHSHGGTLLLALRDGCHYCRASAPFYQRLSALETSGEFSGVHILAIFPDRADAVRNVLASEKLSVESIPAVDFGVLGVTGTPTVALVDQTGKVLDVWVGQLSDARQQIVLEKLSPRTQL